MAFCRKGVKQTVLLRDTLLTRHHSSVQVVLGRLTIKAHTLPKMRMRSRGKIGTEHVSSRPYVLRRYSQDLKGRRGLWGINQRTSGPYQCLITPLDGPAATIEPCLTGKLRLSCPCEYNNACYITIGQRQGGRCRKLEEARRSMWKIHTIHTHHSPLPRWVLTARYWCEATSM